MSTLREIAPKTGRIDVVAAAAFPSLTRTRVAALVRDGRVTVSGKPVLRPSEVVEAGSALEVDLPPPVPLEAEAQDLPLRVVHEDEDIVVVDKDPGIVVHPAPGHQDGTLVNALLHHVEDLSGIGGVERPGIVHRLDRGTSGLIVVAKNDAAHQHLSAQFAVHSAFRRYLALCLGVPDGKSGTIETQLARHPTDRKRFASTASTTRGKRAVTHWDRVGSAEGISLVACRLETGRSHQVRVHLCEQGWPLVGDPLYRRKKGPLPAALAAVVDESAGRPYLHAWQLQLVHPRTGATMSFEAPIPPDFQAALDALGLRAPD